MKPRCSATWSYSARPASLEDCVCQYTRSEEHTSELQSHSDLVCRLLLEKKKKNEVHQTFNLKVFPMPAVYNEYIIQLTNLGYDGSQCHDLWKQHVYTRVRLRLGNTTITD